MEAERNAETRERNRLAREIHDTLGHALTGIVAGIDACITMLDYSPEATRSQLEKVGTVARQGITDVRRSVSKLRPDALEKLPLEEALRTMLDNMASASGVNISFENQVRPLKFHEDEEEAVYRVIQEASTNAIRHGHAARISICIAKKDQWLTVQVKDNGCGISSSDLSRVFEKGFTGSDRSKSNSTGVGLYLARKLSFRLGLKLDIASEEKEYTILQITFPKGTVHRI